MEPESIEKSLESEKRFDDRQNRKFFTITLGYILLINGILYGYTILPKEGIKNFLLALLATTLIEFLIFDPGRFKRTWQKRINSSVFLIFNIFKLATLLFFMQYGTYDLFSRIDQAKYLAGITNYILDLVNISVVAFICGIFLFFIFMLYFSKKIRHAKLGSRWKAYVASILILALMGAFVPEMKYIEIYTALGRSAYNAKFNHDPTSAMAKETLRQIANKDINESEFLDYMFKNHLNKNEFTGIGKGKNLLIIQVESYQGGFVGKKYNGKKVTPYTDKLINKSFYFSDYFELIGMGNSSDAEFISLHSVYPSNNISAYDGYRSKDIHGLPKIAKEKGYTTFSMHGNTGEYYNRTKEHKRIGFDQVYMGEDYEQDEIIGLGLSDESFFRQSVDKIEEISKKGKFLGFMVTLTCHGPYYMPAEEIDIEVEDGLQEKIFGRYLNAVHYSDKTIGRFLEALDERGILKDTVVAIYGDHHAFLNNDKETNKHLSDFLGRDFDYDEMLKIPLVIYVPGYEKAVQKKNTGSQVDFMPTIMNIMGWNDTITPMFGVDLLDDKMSYDNIVLPQTYMLRGSFITEEAMFEQSRAGEGFKGRFIDRRTRKPLPMAEAAEQRHRLVNHLVDVCQVLYVHDKLDQMVQSYENSDKPKRKALKFE